MLCIHSFQIQENLFVSLSFTSVSVPQSLLPSTGQEVPGMTQESSTPLTIDHWDKLELLTYNLSHSHLRLSQTSTNDRAHLRSILVPPQFAAEEGNSHLAMLHSIQHHCISADVSEQLLTHSLIALSLEHVKLPTATASLPGKDSSTCPLLFDFPLEISLKVASDETTGALVPYNANRTTRATGDGVGRYSQLALPPPHRSLAGHAVCEPMSSHSLLQLLQSLQHTHPYISTFTHKLTGSTVVVTHSGYDGQPLHTHSWQSLAHSRVGFDNYLGHIAQQYGAEVDQAVEEDRERREVFEEERLQLIEARKKEVEQSLAEQQQKKEDREEDGGTERVSAKGGKKSSASNAKKTSSGKRSKPDMTSCATPELGGAASEDDIEATLPQFEERKLYEAYDVGDQVLLTEGRVSVGFLSDGSQVRTEKTERIGSDMTITVSALSNGHTVTCSMIRGEREGEENEVQQQGDKNGEEVKETAEEEEEATNEGKLPVIAGIPQPPPGIKMSSLTAKFGESLNISLSHFGPRGNGQLPFLPEKPSILLTPPEGTPSSESRPQSRQTPQKMSKKQMEQQQQMLEQQRLQEEQRMRERAEAQADYNARHSALLRQNKYQQLFATTSYGLHVRLQVDVNIDADSTLTDGSDGIVVVRQSYPMENSTRPTLRASPGENERYYLPDGSVLCFMRDGSVSVLCPDGHVFQTAPPSLTHLYNEQVNEANDRGDPNSQDTEADTQQSSRTPIHQTFSDTKVTFADSITTAVQMAASPKLNLSGLVWVVTAPSGQRYLWKQSSPSSNTAEKTPESEGENGTAHTEEPGTASGKVPNDQEEEENKKEETGVGEGEQKSVAPAVVVPLPPAQVVSATDPVTKQVCMW